MVWLYVPELEGLNEELNPSFLAQEPFAMSKGKPIPLRSWPLRWKRDHFLKHLFGLTCEPSMATLGVERFLSSLEDSHVNHIQQQGNNSPIKTQEICGRILPESLARLDHSSSSWRMCQMSLNGHYPQFSKTFPKWGMMRRGVLWRLARLERPTKGQDGFSLPTPTTQANMLCDSMSHSKAHRNLKRKFPTPTAREPNDLGINLNRGKYSNDTLTRKVSNLHNLEVGGKLNPEWVEWLMGWPIGFTECEPAVTE